MRGDNIKTSNSQGNPTWSALQYKNVQVYTRVYPTTKMKHPPSMISIELNAPPLGWFTLQQDVSPTLLFHSGI